jgi:hypothetical protein
MKTLLKFSEFLGHLINSILVLALALVVALLDYEVPAAMIRALLVTPSPDHRVAFYVTLSLLLAGLLFLLFMASYQVVGCWREYGRKTITSWKVMFRSKKEVVR